ncbi:LysE family transporter [Nonomuraea sp. NPDC050643]|uniref:LysE family transporter n=1 Tax=Nonomuraea sp. NPDC050643 TaxID=3155660 RepID=UPI0033D22384
MSEIFMLALWVGLLFNAVPGAVFSESLRRGVRGGFRPAFAVQVGSLAGDAVWAVLGLAGVGALFTVPILRVPLTIAGCLLLGWLGLTALRDAAFPRSPTPTNHHPQSAISTNDHPQPRTQADGFAPSHMQPDSSPQPCVQADSSPRPRLEAGSRPQSHHMPVDDQSQFGLPLDACPAPTPPADTPSERDGITAGRPERRTVPSGLPVPGVPGSGRSGRGALMVGAAMSLGNPWNIVYWSGAAGAVSAALGQDAGPAALVVFFAGFMTSSLLWCFVSAGLIAVIRRALPPVAVRLLEAACGAALLVFAVLLAARLV